MTDTLGPEALRAIDTLLAEQPEKSGEDFSAATRRLCAWRDSLVARWRQTRAEEDWRRLERVNAALSVVVGGQFPLGPVPWAEIRRTRADLADFSGNGEATAAPRA